MRKVYIETYGTVSLMADIVLMLTLIVCKMQHKRNGKNILQKKKKYIYIVFALRMVYYQHVYNMEADIFSTTDLCVVSMRGYKKT